MLKLKNIIKGSFSALINNYKLIWMPMLAEVLFLISFGFFISPLRNSIGRSLLNLGDIIITDSQKGTISLDSLFQSGYFKNIALLSFIAIILSYLLYCVFHGFIWNFTLNLVSRKKEKYPAYLKKFFLVNTIWFSLLIIYTLFSFIVSYIDILNQRLNTSFIVLAPFTNLLLVLILYFSFISYVQIHENRPKAVRNSLLLGIKRFKVLFYILLAFALFALIYILVGLINILSFALFILTGIIVIPFLMLWIRIFIKKLMDNI
ncbi:hypothetical protein GF323_01800 [Candidatus Woesearchaeota archaeon]|nr:hypothetical protein [Candidatus Woesearchaeota archaeon]